MLLIIFYISYKSSVKIFLFGLLIIVLRVSINMTYKRKVIIKHLLHANLVFIVFINMTFAPDLNKMNRNHVNWCS